VKSVLMIKINTIISVRKSCKFDRDQMFVVEKSRGCNGNIK